jgi:DNA-directed RNA polymerase specialized sigma24 family protein
MEPGDVRSRGNFPATRHSVIERIRQGDADGRRQAFGDLVEGYWKPLYKHLRITWRMDPDEARDITQGFFADAFQKGWLERYETGKARFRTFVRVCADRYVMNARQAESRRKRGGGVETLSLDFEGVEREVSSARGSSTLDPDELFQQEFVRALFAQAVDDLRRECSAGGRALQFTLFERYDLAPADGVSYAALARELNVTTAQVTNNLAQVRRRFREIAVGLLRARCGSDEEFANEARELFGLDL